MSVAEWFKTFNLNLRMSDKTVEDIAYRCKRITKQLNKDFYNCNSDVLNSFYAGSYGRGTDIIVSDIDMIFELPNHIYYRYNNYSNNGQSSLLQKVKDSVQKTYPNTVIKADGQVIVVTFTDKVKIELVPAFKNGRDNSYKFADTNNGGTWKVTKPKHEILEINSMNKVCNNNLKRLCRMTRAWKYQWDVPISGLLIDTLAYRFLKDYDYKNKSYLYYGKMSEDFFKFLSEQNPRQMYWISPGSKQHVLRKGPFENKAKECYKLALLANKNPNTAKSKWRKIYGSKFPI